MFGLAWYLLTILTPRISIDSIDQAKEVINLKQQFIQPSAVLAYSPQSSIQRDIDRMNRKDPSDNYKPGDSTMMFRTWVLDSKHIPIKGPEWLWRCYDADTLDFYWFSSGYDNFTRNELIRFNGDDTTYFGVFKRKDSHAPFYLKYVIESKGPKEQLNNRMHFPF